MKVSWITLSHSRFVIWSQWFMDAYQKNLDNRQHGQIGNTAVIEFYLKPSWKIYWKLNWYSILSIKSQILILYDITIYNYFKDFHLEKLVCDMWPSHLLSNGCDPNEYEWQQPYFKEMGFGIKYWIFRSLIYV
jgi:hypothetical protein